jgi:aspartyl-tRNA(Asn)/glutamyl-tRNA(Gln) amidotransferase subunit C
MASTLTREDVLRIAELAKLALADDEVDRMAAQLTAILTYAEVVQQADTTGVPPTAHPLDPAPMWRDDAVRPSLDRREVLSQAPDSGLDAGLFRVPKVL